MFWTHFFFFFNVNARFYILKMNYDFIQIWITSFQISCNVNHKVINGQYWKIQMIVLFRLFWFKNHRSSNFIEWIFVTGNYIFKKFYRYTPHVVLKSDPTVMLCVPWTTSLRCHRHLVCPQRPYSFSCGARATCFRDDLTALVLSMFKTWQQPWRPYCNLQRCHGAVWDLTTTQQRSCRFCKSQWGRRPEWLGYKVFMVPLSITGLQGA